MQLLSPKNQKWWTAEEAARHARVHIKTLYKEVRSGRLRAAKVGGRRNLRFKETWIDEWMEKSSEPVEISA